MIIWRISLCVVQRESSAAETKAEVSHMWKEERQDKLLDVEVVLMPWKKSEVGRTQPEQVWGCDSKILLYLFQSSCIQDSMTFFRNYQDWPEQNPLQTLQLDGNKLQNFRPLTFCSSWEGKHQLCLNLLAMSKTKQLSGRYVEAGLGVVKIGSRAQQHWEWGVEKLDGGMWVHMDAVSGLSGRNGYICWNPSVPFYRDAAALMYQISSQSSLYLL